MEERDIHTIILDLEAFSENCVYLLVCYGFPLLMGYLFSLMPGLDAIERVSFFFFGLFSTGLTIFCLTRTS